MLKNLLQKRIIQTQSNSTFFHNQIIELPNHVDIFGLQATKMQIQNRSIVASSMKDEKIYFKSLRSGQTFITLLNQESKAFIKLTVLHTGEMVTEIIPCLKNKKIIPVYFKKMWGAGTVAVDLKGALTNYLVTEEKMYKGSIVEKVDYQSFHPNVISHSINGHFMMGCHPNGLPITNTQEYALANRVATLNFSRIIYRYKGVKMTLEENLLLTFIITDKFNDI